MKNLNQFLADYTAKMEADNRRFIDLMFQRALNIKIDLTCIDRIVQGIKDDQPRFDKLCDIMAKHKKKKQTIRFAAFVQTTWNP
jgi:pyruvate-formate lyase-activating enzyme